MDEKDKWVEKVLDGSLRILDVCGTTRNLVSKMKESAQDIESSVRRKRVGETGLLGGFENYIDHYQNHEERGFQVSQKLEEN